MVNEQKVKYPQLTVNLFISIITIILSGVVSVSGMGYKYGQLEQKVTNVDAYIGSQLKVLEVKIEEQSKRQEMIEQHLRELIEIQRRR